MFNISRHALPVNKSGKLKDRKAFYDLTVVVKKEMCFECTKRGNGPTK